MASEGEGDNTVAAVAHVATVAAMAQVAAGNGVGHRGLLRVGVRIC